MSKNKLCTNTFLYSKALLVIRLPDKVHKFVEAPYMDMHEPWRRSLEIYTYTEEFFIWNLPLA